MRKFIENAGVWILFFALLAGFGLSGFALIMVLKALYRMAF